MSFIEKLKRKKEKRVVVVVLLKKNKRGKLKEWNFNEKGRMEKYQNYSGKTARGMVCEWRKEEEEDM